MISERIEDLYAQPLADLETLAGLNSDGSMLAALIASITDLQFATSTSNSSGCVN